MDIIRRLKTKTKSAKEMTDVDKIENLITRSDPKLLDFLQGKEEPFRPCSLV